MAEGGNEGKEKGDTGVAPRRYLKLHYEEIAMNPF